jgi:fructose-bisphosphate aldolase class I
MSTTQKDYTEELIATAKAIATPGKGILAADESTATIGKRLSAIGVENTEANRQAYRNLLFTAEGIEQYLSGVILFEETLYQKMDDGATFGDYLNKKGILVGIKVDKGVKPIYGTNGETVTQGMDNLDAMCVKSYQAGARFAKWRGVLQIGDGQPSEASIRLNTEALARYAAICQANGLVPIVEPEILMDGKHDIQTCAKVTQKVLAAQFKALHDQNVLIEGCILKPNMICPGTESGQTVSAGDIATATMTVFARTVPPALPGINFLSGGQSEEEASENLSAMNSMDFKRPWTVSFSYGRALQQTCLKVWQGKEENVKAAQEALLVRCKANSEATLGKYKGDGKGSKESLHVKNYRY